MLIRFSCTEYVPNHHQLSEERWDEASQGSTSRSGVGMQGILSCMESDHPEACLRGQSRNPSRPEVFSLFYSPLFNSKPISETHCVKILEMFWSELEGAGGPLQSWPICAWPCLTTPFPAPLHQEGHAGQCAQAGTHARHRELTLSRLLVWGPQQ